jgi:hypothetical protein
METKQNIEEQINTALESVKNIQPVELPYGFSDRVVNRIHVQHTNVRRLYVMPPLLKVAAMLILIIVNVFTLRLIVSPQPTQNPAQYVTIRDFVNEYQINDLANEELLTSNTPTHE